MKITKHTDEELKMMNLLQPGIYPFVVTEASDKVSKSGNEMIELKLRLIDSSNRERTIFDYLLDSMAFKVKHFCDITNLSDKYEEENLMAKDCVGKQGMLELIIQKDKSGQYGDKNSVKDYIVSDKIEDKIESKNDFIDDPLPF